MSLREMQQPLEISCMDSNVKSSVRVARHDALLIAV